MSLFIGWFPGRLTCLWRQEISRGTHDPLDGQDHPSMTRHHDAAFIRKARHPPECILDPGRKQRPTLPTRSQRLVGVREGVEWAIENFEVLPGDPICLARIYLCPTWVHDWIQPTKGIREQTSALQRTSEWAREQERDVSEQALFLDGLRERSHLISSLWGEPATT